MTLDTYLAQVRERYVNAPDDIRNLIKIVKIQSEAIELVGKFTVCFCDQDEDGVTQEECDACIHRRIAREAQSECERIVKGV